MVPQNWCHSCILYLSWYVPAGVYAKREQSYFNYLLVLDLNVKLAYAEDKWDNKAKEDGVAQLEAVVCIVCKCSDKILNQFQRFDDYYIPSSTELPDDAVPVIGMIHGYVQI